MLVRAWVPLSEQDPWSVVVGVRFMEAEEEVLSCQGAGMLSYVLTGSGNAGICADRQRGKQQHRNLKLLSVVS
eukprot:1136404-Pelagomonas_calceolata.AAC.4